jgi:3-hydroxyacyl-[acyl-carrier-protein] dehydratase
MLHPDFFTFSNLQVEGEMVKTQIQLNPAHPIFNGHFPGQPILPGVCMLQMVKEVLEAQLGLSTRLLKADDLKFLSFITPEDDKPIQLEIKMTTENNQITVNARLLNNDAVLFKFRGMFVQR